MCDPHPLTGGHRHGTISTQVCSFGADPEFHAEWLRDEPGEATTTGSGSSILVARCQLSPGNGGHEFRGAAAFASRISFSLLNFPPGQEQSSFRRSEKRVANELRVAVPGMPEGLG